MTRYRGCNPRRSAAAAALLLCVAQIAPSQGDTASFDGPAAPYFEPHRACVLLYDEASDRLTAYGLDQCRMPLAPCSTFKIPHALIGLETGAVTGPDHVKRWDGTRHQRRAANQDHDLASAIRDSIVWYFQSVATDIGAERMQRWLDRLDYGNRDISAGMDRFWLNTSLTVTAFEQLDLLRRLQRNELPFRTGHQQAVKRMLLQADAPLPGMIFGKTGSCRGAEFDHGWFVGWWEHDDRRLSFVVNLTGPSAWGLEARKMFYPLLQDWQSIGK